MRLDVNSRVYCCVFGSSRLVVTATVAVGWLLAGPLHAQDAPPPPKPPASAPPIDDRLLEGLNAPPPKTGTPASPTVPAGEDLGGAGDNPFLRLLSRMQAAGQRLKDHDSSTATQNIQKEVADELAQLIDQLRSQQQNSPSMSTRAASSETTPASADTAASTQQEDQQPAAAQNDREPPENVSAGRNVWGHLPLRVREQIQSAAIEEFLPKYQELIEAYYRRLAEPSDPARP